MRSSFLTGSFTPPPSLLTLLCLALIMAGMIFPLPGIVSAWAASVRQAKADGYLSREALAAKQDGDHYSEKGEIQKAIAAYEEAIRLYPDYAEAYYLLGLVYDLQQGNLEKAIACYQRFLELASDSPDARDVRLLIESAQKALSLSSSASSSSSTPSTGSSDSTDPSDSAGLADSTPSVISSDSAGSSDSAKAPDSSSIASSSPAQPSSHSTPLSPAPAQAALHAGASEKTGAHDSNKNTYGSGRYVHNPDKPDKSSPVSEQDTSNKKIAMAPDDRKEMKLVHVPPSDEEKISASLHVSQTNTSASSAFPAEEFISRSIDEQVLKYTLKLGVWQREGYIQKFNELAMARGSSLTNNISEARARLREERQKATEFIDYAKEAEQFLLQQMIKDLLKEWGMDLPQLPLKFDLQKAVSSCQILNVQEDNKYIHVSLEAKINVKNVREQLLKLGYQLTPARIQLQCVNLYGEFKDRFLDAIQRKSEYIKSQSEGLYEIYVPAELFAAELSKMVIGSYGIHLGSVDKDKIIFSAEPVEK
ncbi:MAG: tetratricopeptide repeat protein [bacterium]